MSLPARLVYTSVVAMLMGCSAYSSDDYADSKAAKKESLCVNMEPAQEMKCKEQEKQLQIGLGADKNCNHLYDYERNRCLSEQKKKSEALAESLKKHTGK